MTTTLTIRLPAALSRALQPRAKEAKTSPSAVLRLAAASYVRGKKSGAGLNAMQEHIDSYAGAWDGHCSGEELLKRTRP
jgi:predicted transcriptional regulator